MRAVVALVLVCAVAATQTVYYRRVLDPLPAGCTVFGTRTLCRVADGAPLPAPDPDAVSSADMPVTATPMADSRKTRSVHADTVDPDAVALSWGQDRVNQRSLPLSGTYTPDRTGNGATVWVVGSGVDVTSAQLSGRVTNPFAASSPPYDCHGSGTKAAVTAAGSTYGIATAAVVRGIKVLGCGGGGSSGDLVDGLSYVLANLAARNVVLITVSYTGRNSAVENVIADLIAADATVVAGAGDQATNACNFFPGSQTGVISVAATTPKDERYTFSNYGSCVTMFAPGHDITTQTLGGVVVNSSSTALAAAEVAGAATMVLQGNPSWTGAQVLNNLLNRATQDVISSAKSTPNLLLFVLQGSNPPQPTTSTTTSTTSSPAALAAASLPMLLLGAFIV